MVRGRGSCSAASYEDDTPWKAVILLLTSDNLLILKEIYFISKSLAFNFWSTKAVCCLQRPNPQLYHYINNDMLMLGRSQEEVIIARDTVIFLL